VENHYNVSYFIINSNLVAKKLKLESKATKFDKNTYHQIYALKDMHLKMI